MAQKTIILLTDDISGETADETIAFAYRGKSYEIDLGTKSAKAFDKAMSSYVDAARSVGSNSTSKTRQPARKAVRGYDLEALRLWAAESGLEVPSRGRVAQTTVDAYLAAGGK